MRRERCSRRRRGHDSSVSAFRLRSSRFSRDNGNGFGVIFFQFNQLHHDAPVCQILCTVAGEASNMFLLLFLLLALNSLCEGIHTVGEFGKILRIEELVFMHLGYLVTTSTQLTHLSIYFSFVFQADLHFPNRTRTQTT